MCIKLQFLALYLTLAFCATKINSATQRAPTQASVRRSASATGLNNGGPQVRPLERPSLDLVGPVSTVSSEDSSGPHLANMTLEADWFMMGGPEDLHTSESRPKSAGSVKEPQHTHPRNYTIKRTGLKRKSTNKQPTFANKTASQIVEEDQESSDSNEVFDEADENAPMAGTLKEPECATHGRYYCTYKEDYPLKLVTEVTKYYKWPLEKLFRDLHAQIMPKLAQDSTGNLVCDSITRVVRPGWARNTNDRWLVVINTENYHQYVTEVVCQYGSNSRCNFIPPCYYSSCQQRYNTQKLLVIDPTNPYRGPFLSEFLFPSCCVCYVPSASDSYHDKYRSSPATIYQRTMQQESANNVYPPQFKPPGLLEDVQASLVDQSRMSSSSGGSGSSMASSNIVPKPSGPGEIRRAGEQKRSCSGICGALDNGAIQADGIVNQRMPRENPEFGAAGYAHLGLSDPLVEQAYASGSSGSNLASSNQ